MEEECSVCGAEIEAVPAEEQPGYESTAALVGALLDHFADEHPDHEMWRRREQKIEEVADERE
jgi:hypothetical protein